MTGTGDGRDGGDVRGGWSSGGSDLPVATPAQARLASGLLAWGGVRPPLPVGLVEELRARLEAAVGGRGAADPAGRRRAALHLDARAADRLVCDGWFLDPASFVPSWSTARGALGRAALARDFDTRHALAPTSVATAVWDEVASRRAGDPGSLSAWLNACPADDAERLRAVVADLVEDVREVWPVLPASRVRLRVRRTWTVRLGGGRLVLTARPDLVLDSPRQDGSARSLLVHLRTGRPQPERDRRHLRFDTLVVTLATGRPPFRWGTFHAPEGRAEYEDLDVEVLLDTASRLGARVASAPDPSTPDPGGLRLQGGGWCGDCRRAPDCPAAVAPGDDPSLSQGSGILPT